MELDDGATVHLVAGDIVVQQATRHGWRNKGENPATIAFRDAWRGVVMPSNHGAFSDEDN